MKPSMNEIRSREATHIDKATGLPVKVFPATKGYNFNTYEPMFTAEIMSGEDKGKWTTVFEKNLVLFHNA